MYLFYLSAYKCLFSVFFVTYGCILITVWTVYGFSFKYYSWTITPVWCPYLCFSLRILRLFVTQSSTSYKFLPFCWNTATVTLVQCLHCALASCGEVYCNRSCLCARVCEAGGRAVSEPYLQPAHPRSVCISLNVFFFHLFVALYSFLSVTKENVWHSIEQHYPLTSGIHDSKHAHVPKANILNTRRELISVEKKTTEITFFVNTYRN